MNSSHHPGLYVRENVIPRGMSVTEAAKRLGIGRPALSNFLNGKSALSPEMAVRLEKAFGANREGLLDMQSSYDRADIGANQDVAVRAFVPKFLTIKARQIEGWAQTQLESRSHLAVLLRRLVHSTGSNLRRVDFPGYDNSQRKGSDGFVDADTATPWVPEGTSYWEFGTDQNPKSKAEQDYAARLRSLDSAERAKSTFVFVTPRNWPGKSEWAEKKNKAGDWKSVLAFDASDLEQWLEQSVPAQIWLAEHLNQTTSGFETLEQAWRRWSTGSEPSLTPEIFSPSIAAHLNTFKNWLKSPSERPFVVAADSRDEALAFLSCLFNDEELRQQKDLAGIFTSPSALKTLIASSIPFIPIVHSDEVERELGDSHQRLHCIVIRPRNAVDKEPDISLDLLGYDNFEKALKVMGVAENEIDRLARESGLSPTILRRRLSKNAAIRTPVWAGDDATARVLVPMVLVGTWHTESKADREILTCVSDLKYESVEEAIVRILRFDDAPMWSVGRYRGVMSKIDALFAVAKVITAEDLKRFFWAAEYVLSETDPALELTEENRWAASLYGKKRDHSGALRSGICETLVLLSVHGNSLFQARLGMNVSALVANLIRKLLTPLTLDKLLSHNRNLPMYAEAAPDEFLNIIEEDLRGSNPVVFGLLKPVDSGSFFSSPSRTGLLWALECLAWKPQNLPRVSAILAQLSKQKIDDNWVNKPESSLQAIFRSWMPQTAASVEQRVKALEMICKRFSEVGWTIAHEQVGPGHRSGSSSYRPRWRGDATGAGHVLTNKEMYDFNRKALDLMTTWPSHNEKTLGDLVECLSVIPEDDQSKVWNLIVEWSQSADEASKATLRERIRQCTFTRRGRSKKLDEKTKDRARKVYEDLISKDPVIRHGWLFKENWVQESAEEIEDEKFDYDKRQERIDKLRREAIVEIWAAQSFEGVRRLLITSGAAGTIGHYVNSCTRSKEEKSEFAKNCFSLQGELRSKAEWCLQGFLGILDDNSRSEVLEAVVSSLSETEAARLLVCAPFQASTWRFLDTCTEAIRNGYWKEVVPNWLRHSPEETTELIDRLLDARRPRAAFHAVHFGLDDIETSRLKRLLKDVATVGAEPKGYYRLDSYYISKALESLDGRPGVTRDEMAQLEFLYIDALDNSEHGIPNLESQIAESPALFAQVVALAYKRSDDEEDPPEWKIENPEQRSSLASTAYSLLRQIRKIPGTNLEGRIESDALSAWLKEVRNLCQKHARGEIADQCIGQILSRAAGSDEAGLWPCRAICEAMEANASEDLAAGFSIGTYNSRGVHSRTLGEGGKQEREIAARYRALAEKVHFEFPYVGGILESIAKSYDRDAEYHDSEERIRKRISSV